MSKLEVGHQDLRQCITTCVRSSIGVQLVEQNVVVGVSGRYRLADVRALHPLVHVRVTWIRRCRRRHVQVSSRPLKDGRGVGRRPLLHRVLSHRRRRLARAELVRRRPPSPAGTCRHPQQDCGTPTSPCLCPSKDRPCLEPLAHCHFSSSTSWASGSRDFGLKAPPNLRLRLAQRHLAGLVHVRHGDLNLQLAARTPSPSPCRRCSCSRHPHGLSKLGESLKVSTPSSEISKSPASISGQRPFDRIAVLIRRAERRNQDPSRSPHTSYGPRRRPRVRGSIASPGQRRPNPDGPKLC